MDALIERLAQHFETPPPAGFGDDPEAPGALAYVFRGWPDQRELTHYPSISIDAPAGVEFLGRAPQLLSKPAVPATSPHVFTYNVGTVRAELQVDIFAKSSPERARVMNAIRNAMRSQMATGGGPILRLPLDGYPSSVASYTIQNAGGFADSPAGVGADQWRGTAVITAEMDEVISVSQPLLNQLDLILTVEGHVPVETGDLIRVFP